MSLAVVTDSAACLTEPLLRERAIEVVPLHAIAADNGEPATTSRPSVQELVDAYRRAASRAEEVLAIHISSALSGTMDNARIAAAQLEAEYRDQPNGPCPSVGRRRPQWLRVVDSGTSSGALGLAVLAASGAHDARRGAALAQASTARSCQLFVVDDLGRLARSGRIDRTTARLDGVLGIRPVLALTRDGIRTLETVRGAARARRHDRAAGLRALNDQAPRRPGAPGHSRRRRLQAGTARDRSAPGHGGGRSQGLRGPHPPGRRGDEHPRGPRRPRHRRRPGPEDPLSQV